MQCTLHVHFSSVFLGGVHFFPKKCNCSGAIGGVLAVYTGNALLGCLGMIPPLSVHKSVCATRFEINLEKLISFFILNNS